MFLAGVNVFEIPTEYEPPSNEVFYSSSDEKVGLVCYACLEMTVYFFACGESFKKLAIC
jgi:hypothetical protein